MSLFCTAVVIYHDRYEDRAKFGCCFPCGVQNPSATDNAKESMKASGEEVKRDRGSKFFQTKVATFIQVPLHCLILGVAFAVWLSVAIWQATLIEGTKENEQFLSENHPLHKLVMKLLVARSIYKPASPLT